MRALPIAVAGLSLAGLILPHSAIGQGLQWAMVGAACVPTLSAIQRADYVVTAGAVKS